MPLREWILSASEALVFDTGPLSHFAAQGWLGYLRAIKGERTAVIPDLVLQEIDRSVDRYPHLRGVLEADWIEVVSIDETVELTVLARYTQRLAVGKTNLGECGVLTLAETRGYEAIVDDGAARAVGKEFGVEVTGTVALLCQGIRAEIMTVDLASIIADDLLAGEYRLPFGPGGFATWAYGEGML